MDIEVSANISSGSDINDDNLDSTKGEKTFKGNESFLSQTLNISAEKFIAAGKNTLSKDVKLGIHKTSEIINSSDLETSDMAKPNSSIDYVNSNAVIEKFTVMSLNLPNKNEVTSEGETIDSRKNNVGEKCKRNQSLDLKENENKIEDSTLIRKFPIWINRNAFCWLDATMALLLHSKNLFTYAQQNQEKRLQMVYLFRTYKKALSLANSDNYSAVKDDIKKYLISMQDTTFNYLKSRQGCERSKDDSPIFAIIHLLKECPDIEKIFLVKYKWLSSSDSCTCYSKGSSTISKSVVSFGAVDSDFTMEDPYIRFNCVKCRKNNQRRKMDFKCLPDSLIIHFINGFPHNDFDRMDFHNSGLAYKVRAIIQWSSVCGKKHFTTWIRDTSTDKTCWLNCNDLKEGLRTFSSQAPDIRPAEIHVIMWETDAIFNETKSLPAKTLQKENVIAQDDNLVTETQNSNNENFKISSFESPLLGLGSFKTTRDKRIGTCTTMSAINPLKINLFNMGLKNIRAENMKASPNLVCLKKISSVMASANDTLDKGLTLKTKSISNFQSNAANEHANEHGLINVNVVKKESDIKAGSGVKAESAVKIESDVKVSTVKQKPGEKKKNVKPQTNVELATSSIENQSEKLIKGKINVSKVEDIFLRNKAVSSNKHVDQINDSSVITENCIKTTLVNSVRVVKCEASIKGLPTHDSPALQDDKLASSCGNSNYNQSKIKSFDSSVKSLCNQEISNVSPELLSEVNKQETVDNKDKIQKLSSYVEKLSVNNDCQPVFTVIPVQGMNNSERLSVHDANTNEVNNLQCDESDKQKLTKLPNTYKTRSKKCAVAAVNAKSNNSSVPSKVNLPKEKPVKSGKMHESTVIKRESVEKNDLLPVETNETRKYSTVQPSKKTQSSNSLFQFSENKQELTEKSSEVHNGGKISLVEKISDLHVSSNASKQDNAEQLRLMEYEERKQRMKEYLEKQNMKHEIELSKITGNILSSDKSILPQTEQKLKLSHVNSKVESVAITTISKRINEDSHSENSLTGIAKLNASKPITSEYSKDKESDALQFFKHQEESLTAKDSSNIDKGGHIASLTKDEVQSETKAVISKDKEEIQTKNIQCVKFIPDSTTMDQFVNGKLIGDLPKTIATHKEEAVVTSEEVVSNGKISRKVKSKKKQIKSNKLHKSTVVKNNAKSNNQLQMESNNQFKWKAKQKRGKLSQIEVQDEVTAEHSSNVLNNSPSLFSENKQEQKMLLQATEHYATKLPIDVKEIISNNECVNGKNAPFVKETTDYDPGSESSEDDSEQWQFIGLEENKRRIKEYLKQQSMEQEKKSSKPEEDIQPEYKYFTSQMKQGLKASSMGSKVESIIIPTELEKKINTDHSNNSSFEIAELSASKLATSKGSKDNDSVKLQFMKYEGKKLTSENLLSICKENRASLLKNDVQCEVKYNISKDNGQLQDKSVKCDRFIVDDTAKDQSVNQISIACLARMAAMRRTRQFLQSEQECGVLLKPMECNEINPPMPPTMINKEDASLERKTSELYTSGVSESSEDDTEPLQFIGLEESKRRLKEYLKQRNVPLKRKLDKLIEDTQNKSSSTQSEQQHKTSWVGSKTENSVVPTELGIENNSQNISVSSSKTAKIVGHKLMISEHGENKDLDEKQFVKRSARKLILQNSLNSKEENKMNTKENCVQSEVKIITLEDKQKLQDKNESHRGKFIAHSDIPNESVQLSNIVLESNQLQLKNIAPKSKQELEAKLELVSSLRMELKQIDDEFEQFSHHKNVSSLDNLLEPATNESNKNNITQFVGQEKAPTQQLSVLQKDLPASEEGIENVKYTLLPSNKESVSLKHNENGGVNDVHQAQYIKPKKKLLVDSALRNILQDGLKRSSIMMCENIESQNQKSLVNAQQDIKSSQASSTQPEVENSFTSTKAKGKNTFDIGIGGKKDLPSNEHELTKQFHENEISQLPKKRGKPRKQKADIHLGFDEIVEKSVQNVGLFDTNNSIEKPSVSSEKQDVCAKANENNVREIDNQLHSIDSKPVNQVIRNLRSRNQHKLTNKLTDITCDNGESQTKHSTCKSKQETETSDSKMTTNVLLNYGRRPLTRKSALQRSVSNKSLDGTANEVGRQPKDSFMPPDNSKPMQLHVGADEAKKHLSNFSINKEVIIKLERISVDELHHGIADGVSKIEGNLEKDSLGPKFSLEQDQAQKTRDISNPGPQQSSSIKSSVLDINIMKPAEQICSVEYSGEKNKQVQQLDLSNIVSDLTQVNKLDGSLDLNLLQEQKNSEVTIVSKEKQIKNEKRCLRTSKEQQKHLSSNTLTGAQIKSSLLDMNVIKPAEQVYNVEYDGKKNDKRVQLLDLPNVVTDLTQVNKLDVSLDLNLLEEQKNSEVTTNVSKEKQIKNEKRCLRTPKKQQKQQVHTVEYSGKKNDKQVQQLDLPNIVSDLSQVNKLGSSLDFNLLEEQKNTEVTTNVSKEKQIKNEKRCLRTSKKQQVYTVEYSGKKNDKQVQQLDLPNAVSDLSQVNELGSSLDFNLLEEQKNSEVTTNVSKEKQIENEMRCLRTPKKQQKYSSSNTLTGAQTKSSLLDTNVIVIKPAEQIYTVEYNGKKNDKRVQQLDLPNVVSVLSQVNKPDGTLDFNLLEEQKNSEVTVNVSKEKQIKNETRCLHTPKKQQQLSSSNSLTGAQTQSSLLDTNVIIIKPGENIYTVEYNWKKNDKWDQQLDRANVVSGLGQVNEPDGPFDLNLPEEQRNSEVTINVSQEKQINNETRCLRTPSKQQKHSSSNTLTGAQVKSSLLDTNVIKPAEGVFTIEYIGKKNDKQVQQLDLANVVSDLSQLNKLDSSLDLNLLEEPKNSEVITNISKGKQDENETQCLRTSKKQKHSSSNTLTGAQIKQKQFVDQFLMNRVTDVIHNEESHVHAKNVGTEDRYSNKSENQDKEQVSRVSSSNDLIASSISPKIKTYSRFSQKNKSHVLEMPCVKLNGVSDTSDLIYRSTERGDADTHVAKETTQLKRPISKSRTLQHSSVVANKSATKYKTFKTVKPKVQRVCLKKGNNIDLIEKSEDKFLLVNTPERKTKIKKFKKRKAHELFENLTSENEEIDNHEEFITSTRNMPSRLKKIKKRKCRKRKHVCDRPPPAVNIIQLPFAKNVTYFKNEISFNRSDDIGSENIYKSHKTYEKRHRNLSNNPSFEETPANFNENDSQVERQLSNITTEDQSSQSSKIKPTEKVMKDLNNLSEEQISLLLSLIKSLKENESLKITKTLGDKSLSNYDSFKLNISSCDENSTSESEDENMSLRPKTIRSKWNSSEMPGPSKLSSDAKHELGPRKHYKKQKHDICDREIVEDSYNSCNNEFLGSKSVINKEASTYEVSQQKRTCTKVIPPSSVKRKWDNYPENNENNSAYQQDAGDTEISDCNSYRNETKSNDNSSSHLAHKIIQTRKRQKVNPLGADVACSMPSTSNIEVSNSKTQFLTNKKLPTYGQGIYDNSDYDCNNDNDEKYSSSKSFPNSQATNRFHSVTSEMQRNDPHTEAYGFKTLTSDGSVFKKSNWMNKEPSSQVFGRRVTFPPFMRQQIAKGSLSVNYNTPQPHSVVNSQERRNSYSKYATNISALHKKYETNSESHKATDKMYSVLPHQNQLTNTTANAIPSPSTYSISGLIPQRKARMLDHLTVRERTKLFQQNVPSTSSVTHGSESKDQDLKALHNYNIMMNSLNRYPSNTSRFIANNAQTHVDGKAKEDIQQIPFQFIPRSKSPAPIKYVLAKRESKKHENLQNGAEKSFELTNEYATMANKSVRQKNSVEGEALLREKKRYKNQYPSVSNNESKLKPVRKSPRKTAGKHSRFVYSSEEEEEKPDKSIVNDSTKLKKRRGRKPKKVQSTPKSPEKSVFISYNPSFVIPTNFTKTHQKH